MSNTSTLIITGDKMQGFCINSDILTITELLNLSKSQFQKKAEIYQCIFVTQGINQKQVATISERLEKLTIKPRLRLLDEMLNKEAKAFTHKLHHENVLISKPKKIAEDKFQSQLLIDNGCDIISDHVTRQHLQGMLIIESARQSMISIIENYYTEQTERFKRSFILKNIDSNFLKLIFPLDVNILSKLSFHAQSNNYVNATISSDFFQYDQLCATITINFIVMNTEKISKKEVTLLSDTLAKATRSSTDEKIL